MNTIFSTILYVDNEDLFQTAFENLQQSEEAQNIQLIVIDPFDSDLISSLCNSEKKIDVYYLPEEGIEMISAYQKGLSHISGQYVNFSLASSYYSPDTYTSVYNAFKNNKVHIVSVSPFYSNEIDAPYAGSFMTGAEITQVHLMKDSDSRKIQLLLQAYFFDCDIIHEFQFHEEYHGEALYHFLLQIQRKYPEFTYLANEKYIYTVSLEDNTSTNPMQYQNWWYQDSVKNFIIPFLKQTEDQLGKIPFFIQRSCYYLIYMKFNCNFDDRNKNILKDKSEVQDFLQTVFQAMVFIDNDLIMDSQITDYTFARRPARFFLLQGKASVMGNSLTVMNISSRFMAVFNANNNKNINFHDQICFVGNALSEYIRIRVMNYDNGILHIDASVGLADFLSPEQYEIYAICTDVKETVYKANVEQIYPLTKCFGVTYQRKCIVGFDIPIGEKSQSIAFYFKFGDRDYKFKISFDTYNSRLYNENPHSYWVFKKNWSLSKDRTSKELIIEKLSFRSHILKELKFNYNNYTKIENKEIRRRGTLLRILYWVFLPLVQKKDIWVTFDKLYKAGDNGEYLYQHIRKNHKNIHMYYIIREDSLDYPRLAAEDKRHILVNGTLKCQLVSLFAKNLLATHANISAQYNPDAEYNAYTKDLQRGNVICVQHGLTIQKIAQYQNRTFDNTKLYCCASPYEVENLMHPFYGYKSDDIKLVGLARYDGLYNKDKKIILITPTWRRNIVNSNVANVKKTHNDNFKNSDYFKIYNKLINDERLINCAKKNGYRIVYLLHPAISAQLEDFTKNDYVHLIPATGDVSYEKILCESSVMITDYSGVQFDFAYMKKPLIYYHPAELPPHYDDGGLKYDTMGFGPICKTNDEIVSTICNTIDNSCKMEEEYKQRVDNFFAYEDHHNCERIYKAIMENQ